MQVDENIVMDSLELGSFNEDEMKELMEELEGVDMISEGINGEADIKENDTANDNNQTSPDSDFTNDSMALSDDCNNGVAIMKENPTNDDNDNEEGPIRVTVDTSASEGDTCPNIVDDRIDSDDGNEDSNHVSLLETMCDLSNRALAVHAEIIAARDSMSAVKGAVCFAPSSAREMEDVQMVRDVAEKLPFLFTHQEAQGFLSCSVPRRYASVAMARDLHAICTSIDRECALCEDYEEGQECEINTIVCEGNSEQDEGFDTIGEAEEVEGIDGVEEVEDGEEVDDDGEDEKPFNFDDFGRV